LGSPLELRICSKELGDFGDAEAEEREGL